MSKQSSGWDADQACLTLPTVVSVDTLAASLKQQKWQTLAVKRLDFSQVEKVDSAILALILFWSHKTGQAIELLSIPKDLEVLIDLYDIQDAVQVIS